MGKYNYFYIEDLTKEVLYIIYLYKSFLPEIQRKYYHDSFYFYNIETLLIRTHDIYATVWSNIFEAKYKSCKRQKIPQIKYEMHNACEGTFPHPDNNDERISAEELYAYYAKKYLAHTGVDFLKGQLPPKPINAKVKKLIEEKEDEITSFLIEFHKKLDNATSIADKDYYQSKIDSFELKLSRLPYVILGLMEEEIKNNCNYQSLLAS